MDTRRKVKLNAMPTVLNNATVNTHVLLGDQNNEKEQLSSLSKQIKLKRNDVTKLEEKCNFDHLCRTCSCEGDLQSLFAADPIRIADMLTEIADLKIMEGDPFPQNICTCCIEKLKNAYNFIKQCHNIRTKFETYLNNCKGNYSTSTPSEEVNDTEIKQECILRQDIEPGWNDNTKHKNNTENEGKHKKRIYKQRLHECPICSKQTKHLKEHMRSHTKEKPYKCDICNTGFSSRSNLSRHVKIHLNDKAHKNSEKIENVENEEKSKKKVYKRRVHECPICSRKTQHLKVHMRSHTKEKPYKCELCGLGFASRSNYSRHVKIHLNDKPHVCEICNRAFTIRHSLTIHMKTHSTETPFKCKLCEKSFKYLSQLKLHTTVSHQDNEQCSEILASIDPQRNFLCDLCGKSYLRKYEFEGHLRAHTGEKPFSCVVCGKTFSTSPLLYLHRKTHDEEKPFKCSYCDKHFRLKYLCRRHEFIHTGEKPLKCDLCGKCFRKSYHLYRHKRTHTGEKPFACTMCDKHFIVRDRLNAHIRIQHTDETPYACSICNKKFKDLKVMRRHEKKAHMSVNELDSQYFM